MEPCATRLLSVWLRSGFERSVWQTVGGGKVMLDARRHDANHFWCLGRLAEATNMVANLERARELGFSL